MCNPSTIDGRENVPIGLASLVLARIFLENVDPPQARDSVHQPFDWPGTALSATAVACLLLAISQGEHWGWTSPATLAMFALGLLLATAFFLLERSTANPMIDFAVFRSRPFSRGLLANFASFSAGSAHPFLAIFYLQGV